MASRPEQSPKIAREWRRKAGPSDFRQFAHLGLASPSIGDGAIGKVTVDIRLLFKRCQWGTLSTDEGEVLAGIVYMELNFHQPPDYRLKTANIRLSLDGHDPGLRRHWSGPGSWPCAYSSTQLAITDYFGPKYMVGPSTRMDVTQAWNISPALDVLGAGASVGGFSAERRVPRESRWRFRSDRAPGQTQTINWHMSENEIDKYPLRSHKVYTAFAYVHGGSPFFMHIEVSGEVASVRESVKGWLRKKTFGARRPETDISTTLFSAHRGIQRPLDELARGLDLAMEMENIRLAVPVQIPNADTAAYYGAARGGAGQEEQQQQQQQPSTAPVLTPQRYGSSSLASGLPAAPQPLGLPLSSSASRRGQLPNVPFVESPRLGDSIINNNSNRPRANASEILLQESLARAGLYCSSGPQPGAALREEVSSTATTVSEASNEALTCSQETLVECEGSSRELPRSKPAADDGDGASKSSATDKMSEEEMLKRVMGVALLRAVLCWMFGLAHAVSSSYQGVARGIKWSKRTGGD